MDAFEKVASSLQERLDTPAAKHNVVGASVAVEQRGRLAQAATGKANVRTGLPVTTDTIFQIGSISKVYTATLVMQLVDEGLVDLDKPVRDYVPEFTTSEPETAATVTIRQLLSHTSGIDGDVFDDFGRGDDCVEKYVAAMSGLAQTSRPGAFFSYCNSGFTLLGRLVEKFRGCTWDEALRKHLLEPLGATDTVTLADEAILRSVAVGHLPTGPDGAAEVSPSWFFSRALGPAGVITAPSAELVAFARMHLNDGQAADGTQVLSPASVKAMRELQVSMDDPYTLGDGWGLGWILYWTGEPPVIGHDGATIGQQAYLRIVPEADLVVALLTNGGAMGALFEDLVRPILAELAGARLREPATPPKEPLEVDLAPFLGTYERAGVRLEVTEQDGRILLDVTSTGPLANLAPKEPVRELVVLDADTLITSEPDPRVGRHMTVKFLDPSPTGFGYLHLGGRATARAAN